MRWLCGGCLGSKGLAVTDYARFGRCGRRAVSVSRAGWDATIQQDPEVTATDTDRPVREFSTRSTSLPGLETTLAPVARAQYPLG